MNILVIGVSGFIGNHLYHALSQQGHQLSGCSRHKVANINWVPCNLVCEEKNQVDEFWLDKLQNIDLVINAAGIYQSSNKQNFKQVHDVGVKRLFDACSNKNIRVIQISAIGAEKDTPVGEFLQTKRNADQYLLNSDITHVVLYPGIVLGEGGKTTQQLSMLAYLFFIPMVFGRYRKLPLISIYQLSDFIVSIINNWQNNINDETIEKSQTKVLIAKPETMENLFNNLRLWMSRGNKISACFIYVPEKIIEWSFKLFPDLSIGAFNKQSIEMLNDYSVQKNNAIEYLPVSHETASDSLKINKATAAFINDRQIHILFYINLLTLGVIWVVSGLSSIVNFEQSRELIALTGIERNIGDGFIIVAAVIDIFLGFLLWVADLRKRIIYMQLSVMLIYSLIITLLMPMYWLHPFAPIIKNFAMLVLALYLLVDRREVNV